MKTKHKLLSRLSFFFTSAYIVSTVVVCYACYTSLVSGWNEISREADDRMYSAIRTLNLALPPEYFDIAVTSDAVPEEQYKRNRKIIKEIIARYNLVFLYTMVERAGHYYHTNTGLSDLPYFTEYADEWQELRRTSADGITRYNNGFDSFGVTRCCICRFTTPAGQNYLIGADVPFSEVQALQRAFLISCLPSTRSTITVTIIFTLFFVVVSIYLYRERQRGLIMSVWLLFFAVVCFSCTKTACNDKIWNDTWNNYLVEWITIFAKETQKLGHAKIQKPLEDHSEGAKAYQEILEKHNLWKSQCNNLITYIYTCRLIGANETEFIMSCPSDVNRDGVIEGRIEIGDPPFTPYYRDEETKTFLWSPGMERGFSGLTSLDERMESTLYGGDLITCTAPLFDDNGEVEAIISIDFDIEQWEQMASVMQYKSANTLINTCACLLFVTSFLVLSLRYLRSLAEANTVLARTLEEVKKAQTASHAKSSFLANMSHEIRTPMNAILGFASILLRSELKPIDRENVFEIRRASQNLLAVINDILDIAKIESGKIMTIPVQYGLSSLVNDVVGTIGVRFVQKPAVHFFVEVDPQIPSTLIGDEPRIRQGILNFLSNAVKFTDKGFVRLTIGGRYSNERFILHIAVQDTGRGIKEEDIDKLFHAFEQVDTHRNRQLEGTGLGLAITRHIIEMVGGTIAVETKYDKGSTFSCELPQNIVAGEVEPLVPAGLLTGHEVLVYEPDDLEAKNWRIALQSLHVPFHVETQWSALQSVIKTQTFTHYFFDESTAIKLQDSPHVDASLIILILNMGEQMKDELSQSPFIRHPISSLSIASALLQADNSDFAEAALSGNDKNREKFIAPSAKILVVDDNDTNLRLAIGLLEPYQCQVQCVTSGKEAIALLKMKPVDIVFMDHMMPEMDGIETVQIIRKFDTLTPIIALTANVVAGVQETYYNEGFSDFFPKPIEISNLEHILKTWLPNHKIEAQKPKSSMGSGIRKGAVNIVPKPQCTAELNVQLGIQYSGGNSKLHRQVCDSVLKDADKNLDTMIKAIADKDWHRFTVEVHAVKSSSMSIGAVTLSEFAKQLEALGNESNETAITANWQEFLHLYSVTMQKIQEYLNEQQ